MWIPSNTNWQSGDGVKTSDLNRIEGNIEMLKGCFDIGGCPYVNSYGVTNSTPPFMGPVVGRHVITGSNILHVPRHTRIGIVQSWVYIDNIYGIHSCDLEVFGMLETPGPPPPPVPEFGARATFVGNQSLATINMHQSSGFWRRAWDNPLYIERYSFNFLRLNVRVTPFLKYSSQGLWSFDAINVMAWVRVMLYDT